MEFSVQLKVSQSRKIGDTLYFVPEGARGFVQDLVQVHSPYPDLMTQTEYHVVVLFLEPFAIKDGKAFETQCTMTVHPSNLSDWVELGG